MATRKPPSLAKKQELFAGSKYNQRSTLDFTAKGIYGPKACLLESSTIKPHQEKEPEDPSCEQEDPSCEHHLHWSDNVEMILVMKKFKDREVTKKFKKVCRWIIETRDIKVVCEPSVLEEELIKQEDFKDIADQLITWDDKSQNDCLEEVDLIVCIGGDGTLLYTSSLFQKHIPPIMSFHMGSLGFLTPFQLDNFEQDISRVLDKNVSLTLRHRLVCEIKQETMKRINDDTDQCPISPSLVPNGRDKFVIIHSRKLQQKMLVMNELVVDRGPSPYITNLEVICNDRLVTTVQGDGIIIATPTGSTAYSLAAGSSMVHPSVPCMVMTPICPHSLSFRSIVIPAGVEITIRVPDESRSSAYVAFDGRNRQELFQGDSVVVNTSPWPIPSINNTGHVTDWFDSLAECLQWNVRKQQKAFNTTS